MAAAPAPTPARSLGHRAAAAAARPSTSGGGGGGGGYPIGGGGGGGGIGICGGGGGASGGSLVGPGVQPLVVGPFRVLGTGNGLVMITPLFADPKAASATTVTVPVNPVYDGTPKGATAQTTGTGGAVIATPTVTYTGTGATSYGPSTTPPTNAGTYNASATFAGNDDYLGSSDSKPYTIAKASSSTLVTVANATYDGNPHGGTAAVTGAGGLNQSLTVTYTGRAGTTYGPSTTAPTNAGSYTASATYAGDANHNTSTDSKDYVINKASSTTTVTVTNATYDGNPHGGTASVTGAGGLNQSLTVSYAGRNGTTYGPSTTPPTNAGSYTASASYAGDTNHNTSQDSKDYVINKASSTTTVTVADATYDGNPHGGTASVTGAGGLNQGLTVSYSGRNGTTYGPSTTAPTNAGEYTASASFAGDANHNASQDSKNFSIAKAPSTTTVTATNTTYTAAPGQPRQRHGRGWAEPGGDTDQLQRSQRHGLRPEHHTADHPGDYTASATYPGDANHTGSQDSKPFTIARP
ncbi:MAG: MBG domain-containing protein [Thermomicrobiales bacterium]